VANLFEHKDRRVIPNWRSFGRTTILGELNSYQKRSDSFNLENSIEVYIIDFQINQTVFHAADLLSAAIINNKRDNKEAEKAAQFILRNKHKATPSQLSLAERFLNKENLIDVTEQFKDIDISKLSVIINPYPIYEKIRGAKERLKVYQYNAILYVELSRYYSILGQESNSIQAMKIALHLAPHNRFILRSASRLFAHYHSEKNDYLDYIHRILRKSPMTISDPWLTSAEISISTVRGRNSRLIKKGLELINSGNIHPFDFTELASSIGTVELLNGRAKKSRDLFSKSLINPNDNSLAQIEWASAIDDRLQISQDKFQVKLNYEALALDNFHNSEYEDALNNTVKWFKDQPFSKRPIMFGSNLASTILRDQEKSKAFLKAGLISHPYDPQLLNNLAYALALENKPDEAFKEINKIKNETEIDNTTRICLAATKGLAYIRKGNIEQGRKLYLKAIEEAKRISNQSLNWIAILNYTREEILLRSEYVEPLMQVVLKIPKETKDIEVKALREDVINLHEKMKKL